MSAPKVGDRVRLLNVEGDVFPCDDDALIRVRLDAGEQNYIWIRPEHVEVLAPPVKVGDEVTRDVADRLPELSLVGYEGNWNPYRKYEGQWYELGEDGHTETEIRDMLGLSSSAGPCRVWHVVGGGS